MESSLPTGEHRAFAVRRTAMRRVAAGAGAMALVGLVFLLSFYVRAPHGRGAFLLVAERAVGVGYWLVLAPLCVNALLGAILARFEGTAPQDNPYPSLALARVQLAARVVVFAFALLYFSQAMGAGRFATDPAGVYDALRDTLGRPLYLAAYTVGLTAMAYYLAMGTWAVARMLWPGDEARIALLRWLGFGVALSVWLVSVNVLAYFATGRAFIQPTDTPSLTDVAEAPVRESPPTGPPPNTAMPMGGARTTGRPAPKNMSTPQDAPAPGRSAVSSPPVKSAPAPSSNPR